MNINAKAYRLGDLNNETKFIIKTVGIDAPDMLPDDVPDGTEVALVDRNENQQSMENLNKMRCTATMLTKLYRESNFAIDQKMTFLLTSAILSDTLHFRSPATTTDDRNILKYLIPLDKIDNITSYANSMFEVKSGLTGFSTRQILLLDYKQYTFNNQTWGIGTGETCSMNKILERNDELLKEMNEEKKRFTRNFIFNY
ncbi:unnamed protein product [Rotaria socialis]|uniref:DHHA2 domain-containing protein n=1 Tax=Rotaria socialis TaxID=392032 RepID=A0A818FKH4_9BILA|nr:unnamed protein product [Rotaria socialis]CAF3475831.1 unnamed protein product [Rotaria socialis]CAF3635446.1 unnamed protein product [Rotaria socialis]CAF3720058.1 unnamed protein product [Rotaria socialis]CAF4148657.1 unnamed protein product [Rotaria socialis]